MSTFETEPAQTDRSKRPHTSTITSGMDSIRVLHVDDDPGFVDLTRTLLEETSEDLVVESETDPDEVVTQLRSGSLNVDCIVSDYRMPGMDGLELLQIVREHDDSLPFILFTGRGSEEIAADAIAAGVTDYLQKGGKEAFSILSNRIENVVENYWRRQGLQRQSDLFEAVGELASVGGWEYDVRTETLYWTDEVRRIHELPLEYEPTLDEAVEFYHPADRPRVREAIEAAIKQGEAFEFDCRLLTAEDETRWIRAHGKPRREDGATVRICGAVVDITEQKADEHELRTFREAVENAGHTIYWTDPDGAIEYVNPAFEEMTGYDREEIIGEPSSILKSGVHTDEFYERMWETITDGETWENELVNERNSGERYTVQQTVSPIEDDDGRIKRYVAINRDITDRKEQRRQLNALLERTRELFTEDTREGIARTAVEAARDVLDLPISRVHLYDEARNELVPTATTDSANQVTGEPPTFGPGESAVWDVFDGGEPRICDGVRIAPDVYSSETRIQSEYILPIGDHGVFLLGSAEPNAFEDRTVSLAEILATDVEAAFDRLGRETELRDTSQRLQTVLNHTPDALFVLDDDQRIIEVNERACASLGYERGELLGTHRSEIGRSGQEEKTLSTGDDSFDALRENPGTVLTREGQHIRKDGSTFPVRVKVTWIEQNGENRFLAIARDISEIKTQQAQLRRQNEQLEEFAGIVSHDLRNPLATARTGIEVASRVGDGFDDTLERVEQAHDRMEALIDELLDLARNGQMIDGKNIEPIGLSDVAARGWGLASTNGAELQIENAGTVAADESRLQQLLENLFQNAVDHCGDATTVRVGALRNGFYIEDDGPGIPEKDREDVFDPGYTTRDDGTGFGLSIVRNVADAHGWDITITDSTDGGARFEFTGIETQDRDR